MQRIKGLMTGSLPTFIDAGANFASSAVGEDHLLRHIQAQYEHIYFMGDDTWVHLFPESFQPNRTFESDSFKMLDLDSVDNAIEKELWPLMENRVKKDEWEIAIAHFLGVDHCGHTYGPSDPNMARKLTQMNSVIERLLQQVDNDTLLLIMGDHGMSVDGDHGGESVEELMSTLFLYSGRPLTLQEPYFQSLYERIHNARAALLGYDLDGIAQRLHYNPKSYPIVAQIHLVPTLAYLLNTPIPFGNLGAIIPNLLVPNLQAEEYSPINKQLYTLWHMVEEFRKNSLQVHVYLENYQNQTHQLDFSSDKLAPIVQHLYDAETILTNLLQQRLFTESLSNENKNSKSNSQIQQYIEQLEQVILAYDAFLISTIKYCEAIWAQFDTGCMILGIILLSLGAAATLSIASSQPQQQRQQLRKTTSTTISTITISNSVFVICILSLLGTSIFTYVRYQILGQYFLARNWFEKMGFIDWLGTGVALALTASILVLSLSKKQGKTFDSISRSNNSIPSSWWNLNDRQTIVIAATIQSFTLGSNSYVVWEDRGTLYILNTLAVVWAIRNLKSLHSVSIKAIVTSFGFPLLFMALIRISNVTGQCREEQFPYCDYVHSGMLEFGFDTTGYFTIAYVAVMYTLIVYFS
ncbi:alkaline-phosphatase-like protein, partial [Mycotypha africana]|uniref:alkaline-phosphatase-like protein n=1 Tax=Mycotypha africana TaxID=64632 RepID=UPI0023009F14